MLPAQGNSGNLAANLEIARRDLLDLGPRNTLLNYRPLKSKGVDVCDEKPAQVFRVLVREERRMTFLPAAEDGPPGNGGPALEQPEDDGGPAPRHTDLRLQTGVNSKQLQTKLLATYHAARTSMEEQGVNTLYLALGMLSWREDAASDKLYRAPLILIPVELERSDARHRFQMKHTGEELSENISLAEKLKQDFGVATFPRLPDADDLDVDGYFTEAEKSIRAQTGWTVDREAIALGFFSFAKFLMYRDLDPTTWPAPAGILDHGILQSLIMDAGFQTPPSNYREDALLDDQMQGRDVVQVVDSDSSQTLAILDALDGRNLVIQGPPGTGKSQTIVNLVAGAVGAGKRVLFVSEKMAALDVVKRRLDKARLGAACLELHSNRTNKKSIIEELRRTALGQREPDPRRQPELGLLDDLKARLNAYAKAVNEPIGETGENPCAAYGKLLEAQTRLKGVELPPVTIDGAGGWTAEDTARRAQLITQLQDRVASSGAPVRHPFWGSRLCVLLPTARPEIRRLSIEAASACAAVEQAGQSLADLCAVEPPATSAAAAFLLTSARYVASAPELTGVDLNCPAWGTREPEIGGAVASGARWRQLHEQYDAVLRPEAWTVDTIEARRSIAEVGGRWWRWVSGRWRRANRVLASICADSPPKEVARQVALLDAIAESAACAKTVSAAGELMKSALPGSWRGVDSDWQLVGRQVDWVLGANRGIRDGALAPWCLDAGRVARFGPAARSRSGELEGLLATYNAAVGAWAGRLQVDEKLLPGGPVETQPFATLIARWTEQSRRVEELQTLVAFNQMAAECDKEGLASFATLACSWEAAGASLAALYESARAASLLDRAFEERPALATFDGVRHGNTVAEFRRLDLLQLEHNRSLLAAKHASALPAGGGGGEVGVLWREFEKRARFLPIRSLMMKAGHAIQSIKPVFMMSPLSIANYLPPGALEFDLAIFDEASQVRPVDALGAIVRARQVVVVGDSRQLPPTSFFDSLVRSEEDEPEDDETATSDIESILGLFCSRGAHQRMLRWHYRSRHESLIAVSNHLFYDDRLVVFPSPDRGRERLGLVYRRVENAPYDRSRTRTNPAEARTVAASVMVHAREQLALPREQRQTLGVAAFSVAQMDAVLNELELLRRQDTSCEEFFSWPPHEPFFVKNLENVQGDERDVIFISIGYGRTAEGYLAMSFGPLNRTGGERRLNVLISRARKRCEVFTTLSADDIDLSSTCSEGVAALKTFLHYAETGQIDTAARTDRGPDSDFEEQVSRQVAALGYDVHSQVGTAGFFLDMAVVDPAHPGKYLLGIECDGARYHSARSARDRDRLRQAVLEGLGWRIYRIWSTDWFHNPDEQLRKVALAIEAARAGALASSPPAAAPADPPAPPRTEAPPAEPRRRSPSVTPYECAQVRLRLGNAEMHVVDRAEIADLLAQVVAVESPVHWTEAARRILTAAGIQRMGNRIQAAFEEAMRVAVSRKLFAKRGEFLWKTAMAEPPLRDRSDLPAASRKIELIAGEEIRRAILVMVDESYGMAPEEVAASVCRLFGFGRVTDEMSAAIEPHRDALVQEGRLVLQGANLVRGSFANRPL